MVAMRQQIFQVNFSRRHVAVVRGGPRIEPASGAVVEPASGARVRSTSGAGVKPSPGARVEPTSKAGVTIGNYIQSLTTHL